MASPSEHTLRRQMCEIGRRIYDRGFVAGFDGNLSCRLSDTEILCTPTMISKGFMKPDDLCVIDLDGNMLRGKRKRTSEILLHLAIYKARPELNAVVHCHPPHAVAFSLAREPIPQCVLPEIELCLGEVPIAPYQTPGTPQVGESVLPFVDKAKVIILASHGTVSYDTEGLERAYWWTEVLDNYCRILMLARQLGPVNKFSSPEAKELLEIKQGWGFSDPRSEGDYENCDLCANDVFRESWHAAGLAPKAFLELHNQQSETAPGLNQLVAMVTAEVMQALQSGGVTSDAKRIQ